MEEKKVTWLEFCYDLLFTMAHFYQNISKGRYY